ncbi:MAG: hypothetical protein AB1813_24565 [Verrucomicrobiota bacterium]|jgi:heme/copper-type cytochrome/quinol oxidase subunit 2
MNQRRCKTLFTMIMALWMSCPSSLLACATCFGQSDSAMAKGMNMGIFSLLGVILFVLGGIASFFIYLAVRTAKLNQEK